MTEERKRYLASISREEWIIRLKIIEQKARIRDEKFWLNNVTGDTEKQIEQTLWRINNTKVIIKALKKQLPAPKVVSETKYMVMISCPRCRIGDMLFGDYCPYCGQKLR